MGNLKSISHARVEIKLISGISLNKALNKRKEKGRDTDTKRYIQRDTKKSRDNR